MPGSFPRRPNPEPFAGSLVWWLEVPNREQAYLQGVLEGYDGIGYYQTIRVDAEGGGRRRAMARITSTAEMREEVSSLLAALEGECGVFLPRHPPPAAPDFQPDPRRD